MKMPKFGGSGKADIYSPEVDVDGKLKGGISADVDVPRLKSKVEGPDVDVSAKLPSGNVDINAPHNKGSIPGIDVRGGLGLNVSGKKKKDTGEDSDSDDDSEKGKKKKVKKKISAKLRSGNVDINAPHGKGSIPGIDVKSGLGLNVSGKKKKDTGEDSDSDDDREKGKKKKVKQKFF
ncbi:neuroblast differentiation-associated protein AHNAK-like isoform X2 [Hydra vulgaris]